MKALRIALLIVCAAYLITFTLGMSKKKSYTDVSSELPGKLYVALADDNIVEKWADVCIDNLCNAPVVVKVKAIDNIEHLAFSARQKVCIEETFKGDIEANTQFFVTSSHWRIVPYGNKYAISRGFVNIMNVGEEYLLFLNDEDMSPWEDTAVLCMYDSDMFVSPVFSYHEHSNKTALPSDNSTYVPLKDVEDNEVFCLSEEGINRFLNVKKKLFALYSH